MWCTGWRDNVACRQASNSIPLRQYAHDKDNVSRCHGAISPSLRSSCFSTKFMPVSESDLFHSLYDLDKVNKVSKDKSYY